MNLNINIAPFLEGGASPRITTHGVVEEPSIQVSPERRVFQSVSPRRDVTGGLGAVSPRPPSVSPVPPHDSRLDELFRKFQQYQVKVQDLTKQIEEKDGVIRRMSEEAMKQALALSSCSKSLRDQQAANEMLMKENASLREQLHEARHSLDVGYKVTQDLQLQHQARLEKVLCDTMRMPERSPARACSDAGSAREDERLTNEVQRHAQHMKESDARQLQILTLLEDLWQAIVDQERQQHRLQQQQQQQKQPQQAPPQPSPQPRPSPHPQLPPTPRCPSPTGSHTALTPGLPNMKTPPAPSHLDIRGVAEALHATDFLPVFAASNQNGGRADMVTPIHPATRTPSFKALKDSPANRSLSSFTSLPPGDRSFPPELWSILLKAKEAATTRRDDAGSRHADAP